MKFDICFDAVGWVAGKAFRL